MLTTHVSESDRAAMATDPAAARQAVAHGASCDHCGDRAAVLTIDGRITRFLCRDGYLVLSRLLGGAR